MDYYNACFKLAIIHYKKLGKPRWTTVDDLAHLAVLVCYKCLKNYKKEKGATFLTYFYKAFYFEVLKERKRLTQRSFSELEYEPIEEVEPEDYFYEYLHSKFKGRELKILIDLFYKNRKTVDIARDLGISRQRVSQIKDELIKEIRDDKSNGNL